MKTLLSAIHGGILARDLESDKKDLAQIGLSKIDMFSAIFIHS